MSDQEKVRRRLLPFVAEGKITEPVFSEAVQEGSQPILVATVAAKAERNPAPRHTALLESALQKALADLGSSVRLVMTAPE
jgi:type IV pilus biogenesis protein CpaD/CtpE